MIESFNIQLHFGLYVYLATLF